MQQLVRERHWKSKQRTQEVRDEGLLEALWSAFDVLMNGLACDVLFTRLAGKIFSRAAISSKQGAHVGCLCPAV